MIIEVTGYFAENLVLITVSLPVRFTHHKQ
jgi:hypothetical protein